MISRCSYLLAVVEALKVIVALENALLRLVSKSVALVELLPEGVASAASCDLNEWLILFPSIESVLKWSGGEMTHAIIPVVESNKRLVANLFRQR